MRSMRVGQSVLPKLFGARIRTLDQVRTDRVMPNGVQQLWAVYALNDLNIGNATDGVQFTLPLVNEYSQLWHQARVHAAKMDFTFQSDAPSSLASHTSYWFYWILSEIPQPCWLTTETIPALYGGGAGTLTTASIRDWCISGTNKPLAGAMMIQPGNQEMAVKRWKKFVDLGSVIGDRKKWMRDNGYDQPLRQGNLPPNTSPTKWIFIRLGFYLGNLGLGTLNVGERITGQMRITYYTKFWDRPLQAT